MLNAMKVLKFTVTLLIVATAGCFSESDVNQAAKAKPESAKAEQAKGNGQLMDGAKTLAAAKVEPDEAEKLYRAGLDAYYGLTGEINDVNALKLFEQATANGHALAGVRAGMMLYRGFGANVDEVKGLKKIEVALPSVRRMAVDGDADAQLLMGSLSEKGLGVTKDEKAAFEWYHKSAAKGNGPAMLNLGQLYSDGLGVDRDMKKGFEWINKAADKRLPSAMGILGAAYVLGLGVEKEKGKGFEWIRKAAALGDPPSIISLFELNLAGEFVLARDERVKLTQKAADNGHATAMLVLASMYLLGVDVAKDEKEYVKWTRKAAEKGNAQAMTGLGLAYELGQGGLVRDRDIALSWYRRAANLGHPVAEKAVKRLEN